MKLTNTGIPTLMLSAVFFLALSGCHSSGNNASINTVPVANASVDQHIKTTSIVTLDGSKSSDADNDLLTYKWSIKSKPTGSSATLSDGNVPHPTITADVDGSYVFQLIVNDGRVDSVPVTVTVQATTLSLNAKPVADAAGPIQHVKTFTSVTLDGSKSHDADAGDTLTYLWSVVSGTATISDPTAVQPTFTPTVDDNYVFQLIVNDGTVNSDPVTVTVQATTTGINAKPVADAGPTQHVKTLTPVVLDGSNSHDTDAADTLTYDWSFKYKPTGSNATLSDKNTPHPAFTADVDGHYVFQLIVNDGTVNSDPVTVTVQATTTGLNAKPVADAGPTQHVKTSTSVTLDGSNSHDTDAGDTLTYLWSVVAGTATLSDPTAVRPTFIPAVDGHYVFKLIVNDGDLDSDPATVTVQATITGLNANPVADAGPIQHVKTLTPVVLDGSNSHDTDTGDTLTYDWSFKYKPAGSSATLSDENAPHPAFTADVDGHYVFQLIVNDGTVNSDPATVTVQATDLGYNSRPVAVIGLTQHVKTFTFITLDGSNSYDSDAGDTLTYLWSVVAGTATLSDPTAVQPTFTPTVGSHYVFQLIVNDGFESSDPVTLTIQATDTGINANPVADAGPIQHVKTSTVVTLDGSNSSDADGDTLNYRWSRRSAPVDVIFPDPTLENPTFTPTVDNSVYVFNLIVNDGTVDSEPARVSILADNPSNCFCASPPKTEQGVTWNDSFNTTKCVVASSFSTVLIDESRNPVAELISTPTFCGIRVGTDLSSFFTRRNTACIVRLQEIAAVDGVTCQ